MHATPFRLALAFGCSAFLASSLILAAPAKTPSKRKAPAARTAPAKGKAATKTPAAKRKAPAKRTKKVAKPSKKPTVKTLRVAPKFDQPTLVIKTLGKVNQTAKERRNRLVASQRRFAVALYNKVAQSKGNVVFSPLSLSTALSMVYAGARGDTAVELYRLLSLPFASNTLHKAQAELRQMMAPPVVSPTPPNSKVKPTPPPFQLHIANRLWGQKGAPFLPAFRKILGTQYSAPLQQLNFKKPSAALATINRWVAKATQQKIKKLHSPGSIQPHTQMILVNALYFKSAWKNSFHKGSTKPRDFWLSAKRKTAVATMHQRNWFHHKTTKRLHVVRMSYNAGATAMYLFVPKEKGGLAKVAKSLSGAKLDSLMSNLRRRYLSLFLPKFKFTSKYPMRPTLEKMGLKSAFTAKANFSAITKRKLKLGNVIHQAFIDVHEKGTEAAAATAVTFMLTSLPPKPPPAIVVNVDRPFFFAIRHEVTGAILFFGRVNKP